MLRWPNATLFEAIAAIADRQPDATAVLLEGETAQREYLEGRIADYKLPEAFEFVDSFPRTEGPHGAKVRKDGLRRRVADQFRDT